ncbi:hypothetical protein H4217_007821 [Coemansia sp. RSA 1939]|nr:hypothetical protein H4217_007821 [Coemansia sp. RSA 1939]KAJ2596308.1 hypothetical protein EV177_007964 [Coemansia sp. RSA 1804]KAJ2669477.1 hypothetical protein GGH99_006332 [Coemansia sp. RSA 1285]
MGFRKMFYPNRERDLRPNYRQHCNCRECVDRNKMYGDMWRNRTPVCTCCDCMAIAGQNIPHSYSTYGHTHAQVHTCALPGPAQHNPYAGITGPCGGPPSHIDAPPPKYSLKPHTSHKTDNTCGARAYATPLFPEKNAPQKTCCSTTVYSQPRAQCSSTSCCTSVSTSTTCCSSPAPSTACHSHRKDMYVSMPGSYHPCNR